MTGRCLEMMTLEVFFLLVGKVENKTRFGRFLFGGECVFFFFWGEDVCLESFRLGWVLVDWGSGMDWME